MFEQKITPLPGGRSCHTVAFSGFDAHGGALLMGLSGVYDAHKRLLYRECHQNATSRTAGCSMTASWPACRTGASA